MGLPPPNSPNSDSRDISHIESRCRRVACDVVSFILLEEARS